MKKSELKLTGETYRLTPDGWGETSIMIDESAVIEATADAFDIPVDECDPDSDPNDRPEVVDIATDADGNYYAIRQAIYRMGKIHIPEYVRACQNPADATQGSVMLYDRWETFDEED